LAPRELARTGAPDLAVRIIEYHLHDDNGTLTERFALATTLLDPQAAPARESAGLYHERWQIETAIGAFKSSLKGDGVVLRSKTPDGAEQECWALLCAYHAIRDAICAAAALSDQDPLRVPVVHALDAVRGPVGDQAASPPDTETTVHHPTWLRDLAAVANWVRAGRPDPRHAKRTHRYPTKPADPLRPVGPGRNPPIKSHWASESNWKRDIHLVSCAGSSL